MKSTEVLKATAIVGALVWGIWSLIPVVLAVPIAFLLVLYYGVSVFTVPAWALGIGVASAVLTGSIYCLLRGDLRVFLGQKIWFFAKFGAVLFVACGALAAVIANVPTGTPLAAEGFGAQLEGNVSRLATAVISIYAWVVLVVMPAVLGALSIYLVVFVDDTSRDGAQNP